jgi:hypothetical protein
VIDRAKVEKWISEAQQLCKENDRAQVGDVQIGNMLSHAPVGEDGLWPCEAVRGILDSDGADDIRRGLNTGILNSRGVFSRAYDEGGVQERALATKYRKYAEGLQERFPHLAAVLRSIEDYYENDARRADVEAKLRVEGH